MVNDLEIQPGLRSSSELKNSPVRTESNSRDVKSTSIELQQKEEDISSQEDEPLYKKSRGVILIESVKDMMYLDGKKSIKYIVFFVIFVLAWSVALDKATTSNYQVYATSELGHHTMISTLSIATNIITAISDLFFAKFADLTSRPTVYLIGTSFFALGYIIIPSANDISGYIIGNVFGSLGASSLNTINVFLIGDLTAMKWRGFGNAALSAPHIVITWISGFIVDHMIATNWKWGYGMFAIIIPCTVVPCACVLLYIQKQARKLGIVEEKTEKYGFEVNVIANNWLSKIIQFCIEMDLFGLLLLGTSMALLLLPFSLYRNAQDQWRNPSIIAMFVVGGVILALFILYEIYVAPCPCLQRSNFNRTVITELIFNVVYFAASSIRGTYLSSFVWIYKNWNNRDWTYYNGIGTLGKSIFGLVAGLIHRKTHRYKFIQIIGICIEIISAGLWLTVKGRDSTTALLVMAEVLSSIGGGLSVYSSRTAVQISVPHQNLTMAISTIFLFTAIGRAVGSAVAAAIWNSKMPENLRKYMPSDVSDAQVAKFFSDLTAIREYDMSSPIRLAAIDAYVDTSYYLWTSSLGILFICFIVCFFQKNYYLGDGQNAIDPEERKDSMCKDNEPDFYQKWIAKIPLLNKYYQNQNVQNAK